MQASSSTGAERLAVCLSIYLHTCPDVCMLARLSVCLSACLHVCLCVCICLHVCMPLCVYRRGLFCNKLIFLRSMLYPLPPKKEVDTHTHTHTHTHTETDRQTGCQADIHEFGKSRQASKQLGRYVDQQTASRHWLASR